MRVLLLVPIMAIGLVATHPVAADERLSATLVRVPVAAHVLMRGAQLTADDITYEDRQISRGVTVDTTIAPGWVTRRLINQGEILRAPAVQPPLAVSANGPVDIAYSNGAVAIFVRGSASRAASVGERIKARLSDGRQLDVIVTAPGKARLL